AGDEIADQGLLNVERQAAGERDAVASSRQAVDQETAQADLVARAGIDRDGVAARRRDTREAMALDADRLADGERAVARRVEDVDFAAGGDAVMRVLERAARQDEGAGVGVGALGADEYSRRQRL